jgi:hypothetical protein
LAIYIIYSAVNLKLGHAGRMIIFEPKRKELLRGGENFVVRVFMTGTVLHVLLGYQIKKY